VCVHLAEGNGVLRGETAQKHEDGNHDATPTRASGSRESRAEENNDDQQDVGGPEIYPKSFVGAEAAVLGAGARATVLRISSAALHIGGTGAAFPANTNHRREAAVAGGTCLLRGKEHLQHLPGMSSALKAGVAVAA
jgi:hypothetical protein